MSDALIYAYLRALSTRLKFPHRLHPQLFRHSIAVHLLQGGADIRLVQEFRTTIDTTKTYTRLVPGRLKEDYHRAMPAAS